MTGGAAFAGLAAISVPQVIGLLAAMCFLAAILAQGLDKVQHG